MGLQEDVNTEFHKGLKAKLLTIMEKEKLYLDASLTIHSLANQLNSNSKYLSQLINNDLKKNFVLFVNEYRIREAKRLLLDKSNNNITIESIGYDVGFKSKSAFNAVFKKITNQTPSEFRNN
ncbi:MAG: AraC family transcriptional regulator [Flavobacteriaceae bacterium]|nr:AraC family transcriptional regulator [Flavobacteriaceae bacterium]